MDEDIALLRQYAVGRNDAAFAALVERHLAFVYSAALRQLGGAVHRAEDVTQSVFVQLARHAGSVARRDELVGWLYTSTRYAAANLKRTEARRQLREQEAHLMHELLADNPAEANWERLRPVLDDALHDLRESDRRAILLRFFQNERFAEVGRRLGLSEDAARMRVERALDRLRALLAKRGMTSTASALAAALAHQPVVATPLGLAANVTGAALSGAAVGTGPLAAVFCFMTATKVTTSLTLAGAIALGLGLYQSHEARAAARDLSRVREEHATLAARRDNLEAGVAEAEQERASREAALVSAKAALTAAPTATAEARRVPATRTPPGLQQLLTSDPGFLKLRADANRAAFRAQTAPFLKSIGFTAEQIEEAVNLYAETAAPASPRQPGETAPVAASYLSRFRATFGEASADKYAEFVDAMRVAPVVNDFSAKLAYANVPITVAQAQKLARIINSAASSGTGGLIRNAVIDWERVLAEAASVMSPAQLQALRAQAAYDHNQRLLAGADLLGEASSK